MRLQPHRKVSKINAALAAEGALQEFFRSLFSGGTFRTLQGAADKGSEMILLEPQFHRFGKKFQERSHLACRLEKIFQKAGAAHLRLR